MSSSFRIRTNKYDNVKKKINEHKKSFYSYDITNVIGSTIYMNTIDSDCNNMIQEIYSASIHASSLQLQPTFHAIFNQQIFRDNYWQKNPFVIKSILNNLKDAYRMDDVKKAVERDFFDAGISAMFMYLWLLIMNFYITSIYHVMTLTSR
jgi:Cdc6-like AAA superfamily ATPase